jgi:hypothetical protein
LALYKDSHSGFKSSSSSAAIRQLKSISKALFQIILGDCPCWIAHHGSKRQYIASELLERDRCEFLHCETKGKTDRPGEVPYFADCEFLPSFQSKNIWELRPLFPVGTNELVNASCE